MIRVAQVVRPAAGGMRRHVSSLLSNLDRSEFKPSLFAPPDFQLEASVIGVPHVPTLIAPKTSPFRDLRAIVTLSRRLRGAFDLVHAHGIRGAIIGVPAARLARIPALFTAHNLVPPSGRLTSIVLRFLGNNASLVAVSHAVARSLQVHGVSSDRIQVVPNGIDLTMFKSRAFDEATRRRILADLLETSLTGLSTPAMTSLWLRDARNLDKKLFVITGIGRLSPEKGFDILISALSLPELLSAGSIGCARLMLIIPGSGAEQPRLMSLAAHVPDLWLTGNLADVAPLLAAADVVAIPSREEGQSLVALEAMASRKPVVATSVGGLTETIVDGETGKLVPPDDPAALAAAIRQLAVEPQNRARMGQKGRERVEQNYTLKQMIDRIEAIYRLTAGKNDLPGP